MATPATFPRASSNSTTGHRHRAGGVDPIEERIAEYMHMSLRDQRLLLGSLRELSPEFRAFDRRSSLLVYTALVGFTLVATSITLHSFGVPRLAAMACALVALVALMIVLVGITRRREALLWAAIAAHSADLELSQPLAGREWLPEPRTEEPR
ncbi:VIT1/CCC1 family predicted Fe2+/Mn2+ transporter [Crossiella equi]|uniref:VIT1/CCC1 family predicted Fe2+/Mn2+ transporter n=1 Tax=Crossiella equi TaxID=130796 RepID=A0ABS5AEC0_9PSEU|nr:hypothetical protein [Crossiella equi]MBP2474943.1 VIT1/CCC1 family predicted Fe2+/Mn2+ transporter [Crossiella equi]